MTQHHDDDDLRARFRALAERADATAPEFSRAVLERRRSALMPRRSRRAWVAVVSLTAAAAAAAVVVLIARPREPEPSMFDFTTTTWIAPSDFLLVPPGPAFLSTTPAFVTVFDSLRAAPTLSRGDTSGGEN